MKRRKIGALLIISLFVIFPSVRAFGYTFYSGIDLKQYRGTYKELTEIYFDLTLPDYKITDISEANIVVNGSASQSEITDYLAENDQRRIKVPIDGVTGNNYSITLSIFNIKVCKKRRGSIYIHLS